MEKVIEPDKIEDIGINSAEDLNTIDDSVGHVDPSVRQLNDNSSIDKLTAGNIMKSANFITGSSVWQIDGNGNAEFNNVTVRGTIIATSGAIGGFNIGSDYIRDTANSFGLSSTVTGGDDVRFWAGDTFANRATAPFRVTESGILFARLGTIGGFTIGTTTLTATDLVLDAGNQRITVGSTNKITIDGATGTITSQGNNWTLNGNGGVFGFNKLYLSANAISVNTDTTETTLVSVPVPSSILGTANGIYAILNFSNIAVTAGNHTITFRLKYGSTTLVTSTITNGTGSNQSGYCGDMYFKLFADGTTNSQFGNITSFMVNQTNALRNTFSASTDSYIAINQTGSAAEDSTTVLNFIITAQLGTSSAGDAFTMESAVVQKIV